ncbi:MAG: hypothetical protein H0U82_00355 [Actinobacteria bacterium]|nr:hypothetical protein [Actinomycetota bacterium]
MGNRQQTMAKIARERSVKERRERKEEKKRLRKLAAAEGTDLTADGIELPEGEIDATSAPAEGDSEIADEPPA